MSRIGISITKTVLFRGVQQEFSNVYYYTNLAGLPDAAGADALIDQLTALEKTFHSTLVTFVRGRCWSQVGSPAGNNMISQKNLSGTGARSVVANMDRERAFLFRLRAGVDSRGQPVYLRKWYHSCGFFASISIDSGKLENTSGFTSTEKDTMRTAVQGIGSLSGSGGPWDLCAKSGRMATAGEVWQPHTYLEHHQLGDQWRAN
jgi:hypothetical protein